MYAELKMDLDYETSKEMKKKMFYQSCIKINNNKNEFIIIEMSHKLDKRLMKGIVKELNNKNDFIILKNNKYNEVSNSLTDLNEEEIFYIKNNELHLIFKYIHIIMPLTCNIMDSIFLQNIVNIKLI
jgi:hypothetical protein